MTTPSIKFDSTTGRPDDPCKVQFRIAILDVLHISNAALLMFPPHLNQIIPSTEILLLNRNFIPPLPSDFRVQKFKQCLKSLVLLRDAHSAIICCQFTVSDHLC